MGDCNSVTIWKQYKVFRRSPNFISNFVLRYVCVLLQLYEDSDIYWHVNFERFDQLILDQVSAIFDTVFYSILIQLRFVCQVLSSFMLTVPPGKLFFMRNNALYFFFTLTLYSNLPYFSVYIHKELYM